MRALTPVACPGGSKYTNSTSPTARITTATVAKTSSVRYRTWTWSYGALDTAALSRIDWPGVVKVKDVCTNAAKRMESEARTPVRARQGEPGRPRDQREKGGGGRGAYGQQGARPPRRNQGGEPHVHRGHLVRPPRRPAIAPRATGSHLRPTAQRSAGRAGGRTARHASPGGAGAAPASRRPQQRGTGFQPPTFQVGRCWTSAQSPSGWDGSVEPLPRRRTTRLEEPLLPRPIAQMAIRAATSFDRRDQGSLRWCGGDELNLPVLSDTSS